MKFKKLGLLFKRHAHEFSAISGVLLGAASLYLMHKGTIKALRIDSDDPDKIKKTVKTYAPSVLTFLAGSGLIFVSLGLMNRRHAALIAAYNGVSSLAIGDRLAVQKSLNDDGIEIPMNKHTASPYARVFDETSEYWTKDPTMNLHFINEVEDKANEILERRGYILLNQVYEMLGFEKTIAGETVGWELDGVFQRSKPLNGDDYISFGVYDLLDPKKKAFINGAERSVWLDFNVDGAIF